MDAEHRGGAFVDDLMDEVRMSTGNILLDGFLARVDSNPKGTVVVDSTTGESISCCQLDTRADVAAQHLLELGVTQGDYVTITIPLSVDFLQYCLGAFKLGAIPALLDPRTKDSALRQCLDELEAPAWISTTPYQAGAYFSVEPRPWPSAGSSDFGNSSLGPTRNLHDPVLLLFTSGTTGVPKGVPWTSRELASQIRVYSSPKIKTEFCLFPHLALVAIAMGRTAVLPSLSTLAPASLDIASLHRQMVDHGADYMFASPLTWQRLADYLELGHQPPHVIRAAIAGSAVNCRLMEQLSRQMPDTAFWVPFASTEVLMPISQISAADYIHYCGLGTWAGRGVPLGSPAPEMTLGIIDPELESAAFDRSKLLETNAVGEIVVAGDRVTEKYFKRHAIESHAKMRDPIDATVWHRTADIGHIDDRGQLWYLCRKKDVINRRGRTYYPDAIEAMLNMVTGAALSAVVFDEDEMFYVVEQSKAPRLIDAGSLAILCQRLDLPPPRIVLLDSPLPTDPRHNSKIDRQATLAQVVAFLSRTVSART